MLDPEDDEVHASSTPASARIIRSSATTQTTRCGSAAPARSPAGSTPRCSTRPAMRQKSQGWSPFVLDTNGNGKRDDYVEPEPADRPGQGQAHRAGLRTLCGDAEPGGWLDLVHRRRVRRHAGAFLRFDPEDRAVGSLQCAGAGLRRPRRRHRQERRRLGVARRAAISAASTGASAKVRSTARRPPAITARKAGRSTSIPARASKASARTAPSRAITPGSTSTTRSASARTSRCRPPTSTTASSR